MIRLLYRAFLGWIGFLCIPTIAFASNENYVVEWIRYPVVEAVLAAIIFISILAEIKTAGFSGGGLIAVVAGGMLLGVNWYIGVVDWYEFLLYFGGLALILFDLFILVSGFGVAVGILFMLTGLYFTFGGNVTALWVLTLAIILAIAGMYFIADHLPESYLWKKIALHSTLTSSKGFVSSTRNLFTYEGKEGIAVTVLRPSGKVKIDGVILDAVTDGDFINQGIPIKVLRIEGNRLIVGQ